ncbi:MAG: hypothetical protein FJ225_04460 [Lentisphaerae bacterium]|nr:hypothetical protein [Lentisphaerota bacterium]
MIILDAVTRRLAGHALRWALGGRWAAASPELRPLDTPLPADFFGICAAGSPEPGVDEYVLARLKELGVRHVRVDVTRDASGGFARNFPERLLSDGFRVCLHPVQPRADAALMPRADARERWRGFIASLLDAFAGRIELLEIGSTCNRRKWTGYTPAGFLAAWRIAHAEAARRGVPLAGPNATDFEPLYNAAWLGLMRRQGLLPAVHTDNLFVERATQPEAFDHKIMGRALAGLGRFNLVKKARIMRDIAASRGVPSTVCAHVAWSRRRLERRLALPREKQADYLARYLCLAAASGALDRVYWGPLVGQREGLVDDGTAFYPELPHVWLYARANGSPAGYTILPAFDAFRALLRLLPGTVFTGKRSAGHSLFILEFLTATRRLHAVWTVDGRAAAADDCYDAESLRAAEALGRDGRALERPPALFSESPVYLLWPRASAVAVKPGARVLRDTRVPHPAAQRCIPVRTPQWTGIRALRGAEDDGDLMPEHLGAGAHAEMLRQGRNAVWRTTPRGRDAPVVVKRFHIRAPHRRLLDRRKPSRALRAWNGAAELMRRGIPTPRPLAFFQSASDPALADSVYVCESFEGSGSVRTAFTLFARGGTDFEGLPAAAFYARLAAFVRAMHERGVFFRDLSPGNVLVRVSNATDVAFALIDTTRLRGYPREVPLRRRLSDLKRLGHPLPWSGRRALLQAYLSAPGPRFRVWMLWPSVLYDLKHALKRLARRRA